MVEALLAVDSAAMRRILALPHPQWLNTLMLAASLAGIGGAIWLVAGVVLFFLHRIGRLDVIRLIIAILLVHVVVDLGIKPWIARPRPPLAIPEATVIGAVPETASFPSGHAANASAGALVLTASLPALRLRILVWSAALIVGVARVYLGVHYPIDAIAGALIGAVIGWTVLRVV
jgi:undecaprenyl-diphosphatase